MVFNIALGDGLNKTRYSADVLYLFSGCCFQFFSAKSQERFEMIGDRREKGRVGTAQSNVLSQLRRNLQVPYLTLRKVASSNRQTYGDAENICKYGDSCYNSTMTLLTYL